MLVLRYDLSADAPERRSQGILDLDKKKACGLRGRGIRWRAVGPDRCPVHLHAFLPRRASDCPSLLVARGPGLPNAPEPLRRLRSETRTGEGRRSERAPAN